jgi:Uncharacterized conserved protein (COG2071)
LTSRALARTSVEPDLDARRVFQGQFRVTRAQRAGLSNELSAPTLQPCKEQLLNHHTGWTALSGLEHFLVERYCLYPTAPGARLCRADIHHAPWPLRRRRPCSRRTRMVEAACLRLPPTGPVAP